MSKAKHVREAVNDIERAIAILRSAETSLFHARNDQRTRLGMALMEIAEIYDILTDPACTPEMIPSPAVEREE